MDKESRDIRKWFLFGLITGTIIGAFIVDRILQNW